MAFKNWTPIFSASYKYRFVWLLGSMLLMLAINPFVGGYFRLGELFNILLSLVFISTIYAVGQKKRHLYMAVPLALLMLSAVWTPYFLERSYINIIGKICGILFFAFAIIQILRFIFAGREVTVDIIAGAASVYLLLALMWSFVYSMLEMFRPGSFNIPRAILETNQIIFLYYSFVTITTLGYGDITPITTQASAMSILEAVVGQLYLVVLVAWLVGMHVSKRMQA